MSARTAKRAAKALAQRQRDFDALTPQDRLGRKRPGSLNPRKSVSTRTKKVRRSR